MELRDKLEIKLKELGLWERWIKQGMEGVVAEKIEDKIILIAHWVGSDCVVIEFPTLDKLRCDKSFKKSALEYSYKHKSGLYFKELYGWLNGLINECPIDIADLYYLAPSSCILDAYSIDDVVPD